MTLRDIIKRAMRTLGKLEAGQDPDPADAADCLAVLQSLILSLPGSAWWNDVVISADHTASEGERISNTSGASATITLPVTVASSTTILTCCDQIQVVCSGYADRIVKDGARVQIAGSTPITYRYRADLGAWSQASGLTLTDEAPINADLQDGLAAMLAIRMAPEFGAGLLAAETQGLAATTAAIMRARYGKRQNVGVDAALCGPQTYGGAYVI